ncbi:hypothetical protein F5Y15DRAFT_431323 [Xylariaceae sp. FL0016]|nr:hypothetical protein F5Y15DRAFT_431323 [Xylariaceae sp. FL0016]
MNDDYGIILYNPLSKISPSIYYRNSLHLVEVRKYSSTLSTVNHGKKRKPPVSHQNSLSRKQVITNMPSTQLGDRIVRGPTGLIRVENAKTLCSISFRLAGQPNGFGGPVHPEGERLPAALWHEHFRGNCGCRFHFSDVDVGLYLGCLAEAMLLADAVVTDEPLSKQERLVVLCKMALGAALPAEVEPAVKIFLRIQATTGVFGV